MVREWTVGSYAFLDFDWNVVLSIIVSPATVEQSIVAVALMKGYLFVVFLLSLSSALLGLSIASLATPKWGENKETGFTTGLNSYCNMSECYAYTKAQKVGALFATGFFIYVTIFANFFFFMFSATLLYYVIKDGDEEMTHFKMYVRIVAGNCGISCLSSLIAMCCFTGGYPSLEFGYSYYLGWGVCGASGTMAIVMLGFQIAIVKYRVHESKLCSLCFPKTDQDLKIEEQITNPSVLVGYELGLCK